MSTIDPIGWLYQTIKLHPAKAGEPPWCAGTSSPARPGWYERHLIDGLFKHWWDGGQWLASPAGAPHWRQVGDYPAWRAVGLQLRWTRINLLPNNRMLRIGIGQNDGHWFARLDLWWTGWRLTW